MDCFLLTWGSKAGQQGRKECRGEVLGRSWCVTSQTLWRFWLWLYFFEERVKSFKYWWTLQENVALPIKYSKCSVKVNWILVSSLSILLSTSVSYPHHYCCHHHHHHNHIGILLGPQAQNLNDQIDHHHLLYSQLLFFTVL